VSKADKPLPKPTPSELELLRIIWRLGPSTVREVHAARQQERPDATYANVLRMMQIMHGKGLLARDESGRSHIYSSVQKQEATRTNLLRDFINKAFAGSARDLVLAALSTHASEKEREEIRRFLRETRDE